MFFLCLFFKIKVLFMSKDRIKQLLDRQLFTRKQKQIVEKILEKERLDEEEGVILFKEFDLPVLSVLANYVREELNGKYVYFNRNFHIEPTNICIYKCKFCSYARRYKDPDAWDYSLEEMLDIARRYVGTQVTEVHIVGGVHPRHDVYFYGKLIKKIKEILPDIHVKAFTAVELDFMIRKAKLTIEEGLKKLKEYGLDSIPGGGAEIFNPEIRKIISHEKSDGKLWLKIHETAHRLGIPSNATILYGHIENYEHRIEHLAEIRKLQDKTGGFNAFIPLKYRMYNNELSYAGEVSVLEDMKNYAVTRLFLDNIKHLKAYWVMLGKQHAQMALLFGVDDLDGTIDDTTKIYSMAGVKEKTRMTVSEMTELITRAGFIPVERDSVYNIIKIFEPQKKENEKLFA